MSRLISYDPIGLLSDINRLFDMRSGGERASGETNQWVPAVDVKEDNNSYHFLMDLPGIKKEDVSVSMHDNVLTVEGVRQHEKEDNNNEENYYRYERVKGKFYRQFTLPESVDEDNIRANMKHGVMEIVIPKKEVPKTKSIDIMVED